LILASHPVERERRDAFWLVAGRLIDWGAMPEDLGELTERTAGALGRAGRGGELGAHVPPDEVDEVRLVRSYLASHPELRQLRLDPPPAAEELAAFAGLS
jgi:hypothetical protein